MNKIQRVASVYLLVVLMFGWGFSVGKYQVFPYKYFVKTSPVPDVENKAETLRSAVQDIGDKIVVIQTGIPKEHIAEQPPRLFGVKNTPEVLGYKNLLINSWYNSKNAIRLMDANGKTVKDWMFDVKKAFPKDGIKSDDEIDFQSSIVFSNGDAIANFDYHGLVKIDKCGKILWMLPKTHHSIYQTPRNTFWVPGFEDVNHNIKSLRAPVKDEFAWEVDKNGKIIRSISILDVIFKNNLQAIIINRDFEPKATLDVIHLNDIEELTPGMAKAFPQFAVGDLMISSRNANLIMIFDPNTLKVKWYQVGPWLHQHDPDFQSDGTISIFNNNSDNDSGLAYGGSSVVKIDPKTREVKTIYKGRNFYTNIRGAHTILENGDMLLTEFNKGRVSLVSKEGKILYEYVNMYNHKKSFEISGAELLDKDYFKVNLECGK